MSKRHNRKRTRSRPRNRLGSGSSGSSGSSLSYQNLSYHPSAPSPYPSSSTGSIAQRPLPASHWDQQFGMWQARKQLSSMIQQQAPTIGRHPATLTAAAPPGFGPTALAAKEASLDAQRMQRFFGGSGTADDEESLCAPMLQVVLDLFNGRIDYEDP